MSTLTRRKADTAIAYVTTWLIVALLVALGIGQIYIDRWHDSVSRVPFAVVALASGMVWLWNHRLHATHRGRGLRVVLTIFLVPLTLVLCWAWMWMMPSLALSAILMFGGRWKWGFFVAVSASVYVINVFDNPYVMAFVPTAVAILVSGVLTALTRMLVVVQELASTREQVARLRVDEERSRIQRDLHDLLGRTLVTVSMRTQTALRLIGKDPSAARVQLEETAALVASGQAQLRELVAGRSIVGLEQELTSAQELCARLGVRLDLQVEPIDDPSTDALAARMLREAMTNMLKHSRPSVAAISIVDEAGCTVVTVDNDGAVGLPPGATQGTGLRDLQARVEDHLGGVLVSGRQPGGHFRVQARIPRSLAASRQLSRKGTEEMG